MTGVDYALLPIFIAIVEQGSLTKAADSLHMTKSAISKKLMALEASTGIRLITRSTFTTDRSWRALLCLLKKGSSGY
ncbi:LysR family transcriptional regulator [Providencia alcalifaciens]|uniref:LysR family transcriptional regulator n=1 Tax=Providencia TaxID=586 RepID=UPI001E6138AF|nr:MULTISPECIES: LysR family transcriptional regulator [Providencia]